MAFCKSCGAAIEWHKTEAGKNMPIDPEPHPEGNLTFNDRVQLVYATPGSKPRMYRSHFVTCPDRDKWRKPKQRRLPGT